MEGKGLEEFLSSFLFPNKSIPNTIPNKSKVNQGKKQKIKFFGLTCSLKTDPKNFIINVL
jgi:hypothetical protein